MTEDLQHLLESTEGQGPSAEFVTRLRAQIVAETEGSAVDTIHAHIRKADHALDSRVGDGPESADELSVVFDLETLHVDEGQRKGGAVPNRRFQVLAAAAAAAIVFVGIWALSIDDDPGRDEVDTVDTPTTTTEVVDADQIGMPLTASNLFFDPGTFRIDTLGTEFTFDVEETRGLLLNENDIVLITNLRSRNADDRTITLRRTPLLPDPTSPTGDFDPSSGWPATDLEGWLELVSDNVTATTPTRSALGGLDATFVELQFPCDRVNCVANMPLDTPELNMFTPGSRYRMWVVDQRQEDPIVVTVAIDDDDETAWFDIAEGILATLEFGEIEPNPVRRVPAGPVELDVFGGVALELPDEAVVVEPFDGFARIFPPGLLAGAQQRSGFGWGGDVEFLTGPLDTDGVEVTTIDRLLKLLRDKAAVVTELDRFDIGGFEARTFDVDSGGIPNVVLKLRSDDLVRSEFGWESQRTGNLWVIEHPDRGLLLVSTETWIGPQASTDLRPWTEALLRSLEFRDP